jgi:hypothetical protein
VVIDFPKQAVTIPRTITEIVFEAKDGRGGMIDIAVVGLDVMPKIHK